MSKQRKIKAEGFSLVEMLVIVFIIALLSSLVLANYQIGKQGSYLKAGAQRLAGDLRRAQTLSLAVRTENKIGENRAACGYGILLGGPTNNSTQYSLFYNPSPGTCTNVNKYFDTGASTNSQILETITLPQGLTWSLSISSLLCSLTRSLCSIYFEPPDPVTWLQGVTGSGTAALVITLTPISCGVSCGGPGPCPVNKKVTVDVSGRVSIQ